MSRKDTPADGFARIVWTGLGGEPARLAGLTSTGTGDLPSAFAVSDLAAAAIGAAGLAIAELIADQASDHAAAQPPVRVDRRLASLWFAPTLRPSGWTMPPSWDPIAGDYAAADGWIRLHTNAPHHRDAALAVLAVPGDRDAVAAAVSRWRADDLEAAVVARGGCAAAMRDLAAWADHPHGKAVAREPLVWIEDGVAGTGPAAAPNRSLPDRSLPGRFLPGRPLAGIRVLDLTRVLAGPVATRFLAGFGAEVLRIDPPTWDEPGVVPDVTLGKACARLDLRDAADRRVFERLLASADVLVHGYRPDALARLGLDAAARQGLRSGLVDVSLDAYGWQGPWRGRRGFDSLVQMSTGIAAAGMRRFGTTEPRPLPVQALDHATGYVMAAAAVRGLTRRRRDGIGTIARTSLARIAALLTSMPAPDHQAPFAPAADQDFAPVPEITGWGPARRLNPPLTVAGAPMRWDRPAGPLGSSAPAWA